MEDEEHTMMTTIKTFGVHLLRLMMALMILASGAGLALLFGERESRALDQVSSPQAMTLPAAQVQRLTASSSSGQMMAAAVASSGASSELFFTRDGGHTWLSMGSLPAAQISALALAPDGNSALAAAGNRLFRADFAAQTWRELPLAWADVQASQAQITSLAVDRLAMARASDQARDLAVFIGSTEGLFYWQGDALTGPGRGLPAGTAVAQVHVTNANEALIFAGASRGLFVLDRELADPTGDQGDRWLRISSVSAPVHAVVETDGVLLAATGSNGLYRSLDRGRSWQNLSGALGLQPGVILDVTALAADPAEPGVVYAATGFWVGSSQMHFAPGRVFISMDSGSRWQPMPGPNGQPLQLTARVTALIPAVDTPLSVRAVTDQGMLSLTLDDAEALLSQLADGDPAAQAWAALGLGILGDPRATEPLLTHLAGDNAQVGFAAARALGRLGDAAALPSLLAFQVSADGMVRVRATLALDLLHTRAAAPTLPQVAAVN